ncbi:MAG: tRNA (adenosine(37)-N6)-threonylcarbamoyltransferase complex ATPase subunit type 1 TsaE [Deltaproteobacteria bacterium]|nr:tRNA (adenosine(37)-N6)-threonylcarbamoyltransferase complex ATPase subunit type 1 TsaE [Deltaproteobacteria bacterium]
MRFISHSPEETKKIAVQFVRELSLGNVIGLKGDLGSGKTTFVQGMAQGLGIDDRHYVNSPTFTLVNVYGPLVHVDLYRIESPIELASLGLEDYLGSHIVVIEWAEKFDQKTDREVFIRSANPMKEGERQIEIV